MGTWGTLCSAVSCSGIQVISMPTHHFVALAHLDCHMRSLRPLNVPSIVAVPSDVARDGVQGTVLAHRLQDVGRWQEVAVRREVHRDVVAKYVHRHRNLFARVAPGAS